MSFEGLLPLPDYEYTVQWSYSEGGTVYTDDWYTMEWAQKEIKEITEEGGHFNVRLVRRRKPGPVEVVTF